MNAPTISQVRTKLEFLKQVGVDLEVHDPTKSKRWNRIRIELKRLKLNGHFNRLSETRKFISYYIDQLLKEVK